jgi:hypothetical protein
MNLINTVIMVQTLNIILTKIMKGKIARQGHVPAKATFGLGRMHLWMKKKAKSLPSIGES